MHYQEGYVAKVQELAKIKQKQDEDKTAARLHSFKQAFSNFDIWKCAFVLRSGHSCQEIQVFRICILAFVFMLQCSGSCRNQSPTSSQMNNDKMTSLKSTSFSPKVCLIKCLVLLIDMYLKLSAVYPRLKLYAFGFFSFLFFYEVDYSFE